MTTTYPWTRMPLPFYVALDDAGVTLPGAKLYFYNSGTDTPRNTYSDGDQLVANANPVVADAGGQFGSIFLIPAIEYKVVLKDSSDVEQWTADPVSVQDEVGGGGGAASGSLTFGIEHTVNGGASTPSTGVKGDLVIPFACTITGWYLMGNASGSIVVDIWKRAFLAGTPPTVANTITASAKPTLSSQVSTSSTTLTGWTTAISANDHLRFNLDSVTTITFYTLVLTATRTVSVA